MSEEENESFEVPSFKLQVEISQPELAEWLVSIPETELGREVENTLRAGHMVLTMVQAASGEEAMKRFFRPVTESMGELKDTLSTLLTATKKSQKLGELGEEIVNNQLRTAFPMDSFSVVSDTGHQADIHGEFTLTDKEVRTAIIEVKLYTGDVPSKELEKFRKDLKSTGTRYGLMVSLTSRLTGVSGPLCVEEQMTTSQSLCQTQASTDKAYSGVPPSCGQSSIINLKPSRPHESQVARSPKPGGGSTKNWNRLMKLVARLGLSSPRSEKPSTQ